MVSFRSFLNAVLIVLSVFGPTQAVPLAHRLGRLSPLARHVLKRATPAAPHFVAYNDKSLNAFPSASELKGYNVLSIFVDEHTYTITRLMRFSALSFLQTSGAVDEAQNWQKLSATFGSSETPTSSGVDAVTAADDMATWVTQHDVQGIDVNYEDLTAFSDKDSKAESWLISYTQQLRKKLPQGQYILTHAPVAPWFSPSMWSGGGYLAVHKSVGSLIDWHNIQFYNQGTSEYMTCPGLLTTSSSAWPETALFQISTNGVDLNKLAIGKPATSSDASNGYVNPSALASCVSQASAKGWGGGVSVWEYPNATSSWITTVRGKTWPVS